MASGQDAFESRVGDRLQRRLREALAPDEGVGIVLTNSRVGVTRGGETIEPGDGCGAVAAITDRRVVFGVGDPPDRDGEFVASVPHDEVETVGKETETLTHALCVATDDERWAFTARRPSAVDDAVGALESRLADRALARAETHHERARDAADPADRAAELEAALDAYQRAADLLGSDGGPVSDGERAAREDAEAVIASLIAAHRDHGADRSDAAEWELAADNEESAYELYVEAREAYDRALELARAYPPGDPDAIEAERAEVEAALEPLKVEFAVAEATDD